MRRHPRGTTPGRPLLLLLLLSAVIGGSRAFLFRPAPPPQQQPAATAAAAAASRRTSGLPSSTPSVIRRTAATAATAAAPGSAATTDRAPLPKSTAIVGAGPAGLFASIVLARRGYTNITVFDRLPRPPTPDSSEWGNPLRSYNLGLGARGQIALTEAEVWPSIEPYCAQAIGRKDWTPEAGERPEAIYTDREYKTQVIQRDRLASCILADVEAKHKDQVRVLHDVDCVQVNYPEDNSGQVELTFHETDDDEGTTAFTQRFDWVVGADGVKSAVRGACEARTGSKKVRAVKLPERNEFVYKTLPLDLRPRYGTGPGWRPDLNYSARIKEEITIEALPTKEGVYIGVVLFRPDNALIAAIKTKEDAKAFFAEYYPQFVELLREEDLEAFATGPTFRLPTFSYAGPELHYRNNTVLMGDTIHAVKPYYGLGCVSALQDAIVLDRCLDEAKDDLNKALPLYSKTRGPEAKALVEFQAGFDYDAKTKEGFARFILPLILDSIFHRLAPKVFAPNGIRLLQDHRYTYTAVRNRKRRDRALQVLLIGTAVTGVGKVALWAAKTAARVILKA